MKNGVRCAVVVVCLVFGTVFGSHPTEPIPSAEAQGLERKGKQLYWCGQPIRLVGYGFYGVVTQKGFPYKQYLDILADQYKVNFIRVWGNFHWTHSLTPYAGSWKNWDLSKPNDAFYKRLHDVVAYARSKGIMVMFTFFDSVCLEGGSSSGNRWINCPFRSANNVNPYCDSPGCFDDLPSQLYNQSHAKYLTKVVNTLNGFDNVIYEIMNEPYPGYGSKSFIDNIKNALYGLLHAPGHTGSTLIASNDGAYNMSSDPKIDIVSYHVHSTDQGDNYATLGRPVIVSNDGDKSQSSKSLKPDSSRAARVKKLGQKAFGDGSPFGHTHLEILDKDIYGSTWLSQNYQPSVSNLTYPILAEVKKFAAGPPNACGGGGDDGGGGTEPPPTCPIGTTISIDNGQAGYSETGNDWKSWGGLGQSMGKDYRYLSWEAGESNERKGKAIWKPNLTHAGKYKVSAVFRATHNRTDDADYFVYDAAGKAHHTVVDQRDGSTKEGDAHGPVKADLGVHLLEPNKSCRVVLDGTDDNKSDEADGVIFELVECADGTGGGDGGGDPGGGPVDPPPEPPPVDPCPPGTDAPTVQTRFASSVSKVQGWDYEGKAKGAPDGQLAHNKNLDAGEALHAGGWGFCNPPGIEKITKVTIGVRGKMQYDSGVYQLIAKLKAAGLVATWSHTGMKWDTLDVTAAKAGWTFAQVNDVVATVAKHAHPGGKNDSDIWVDSFRAQVTYVGCGVPDQKVCTAGGNIGFVDDCGNFAETVEACDDKNDCTIDGCIAAACVHTPSNAPVCSPVEPPKCTSGASTMCAAGALVDVDTCGNIGDVLQSCDDGNPCTVDSCDTVAKKCTHVASLAPGCTPCKAKVGKACIGGAVAWLDSCGNTGALVESCDDSNPCTTDACEAKTGTCTHTLLETALCKDCTPKVAQVCAGGQLLWKDSCGNLGGVADHCDDGVPCTVDGCSVDNLTCTHVGSTAPECQDCTPKASKACQGGALVWLDSCGNAQTVADFCDDANECTIDACDPVAAVCTHAIKPTEACDPCQPWKAGTICDGENIVWVDGCGNAGELFTSCADEDPCTVDTCDEATLACAYLPNDSALCGCEPEASQKCQGNQVVWVDSCGNAGEVLVSCDDDEPCTVDACDPATLECLSVPSEAVECQDCVPSWGTACDGDLVVWVDSCGTAGEVFVSCDDGDPCTIDGCDAKSASCVHVPSDAEGCEAGPAAACDGEALTVCDGASVVWIDACGQLAGVVDVCMDGDPCTDDGCDDATAACVYAPVESVACGSLDDGSACSAAMTLACDETTLVWIDACGELAAVADTCNDGDDCTVDSCSEAIGSCVFTPIGSKECTATDDPGPDEPGPPDDGGADPGTAPGGDPGEEPGGGLVPAAEDPGATGPGAGGAGGGSANGDEPSDDEEAGQGGCQSGAGGAAGPGVTILLLLLGVLLLGRRRSGVLLLALLISVGMAGEVQAQPVPVCGANAPGNHSVTKYAATAPLVNGWDYESKAQGAPDGAFAHTKNLDAGEVLTGANYWFCNPAGNELITKVTVGVRSKTQYDTGKYKVNVKVKAGGKEMVYSHTGLKWDALDVTSLHPLWTWEFARDLEVKVLLHNHPGGNNDSDVWVDAFRVKVDFTTCTPNVAKSCSGNDLIWMDSCGMAVGPAGSCDDGDKCTADSCQGAGQCIHELLDACKCKDNASVGCSGNALLWYDSCGKAGKVKESCNDGDPCTIDSCHATKKQCQHTLSPAAECQPCIPKAKQICESNTLYWVDSCGAKGAKVTSCDDGDACTIDTCNAAAKSCTHAPSPAPECQPCTPKAQKVCNGGTIQWLDSCGVPGGTAESCDDADECTIDSCDPTSVACTHTPSAADHCKTCVPGVELVCLANNLWFLDSCGDKDSIQTACDDGDPCTLDTCDPEGLACSHEPIFGGDCAACPEKQGTACVEGQLLWVDGCGNVQSQVADACDDGDDCTVDGCDGAALTCTHSLKMSPECTFCEPKVGTKCVAGDLYSVDGCGLVGELATPCEDGDPCTFDSCDPETGACVNVPSDNPECMDCLPQADTTCVGASIHWVDSCGNLGAQVVSCDDGEACTVDTCDAKTGFCIHVQSEQPACAGVSPSCGGIEGTVCMDQHVAWVDNCGNVTGIKASCFDGDACTFDACDPDTVSCTHAVSPDDECTAPTPEECEGPPTVVCDGDAFYWIDGCGTVLGTAKQCDDGDECTKDVCNPETLACDAVYKPTKGCDAPPEGDPDPDDDPDGPTGPDPDEPEGGGTTDPPDDGTADPTPGPGAGGGGQEPREDDPALGDDPGPPPGSGSDDAEPGDPASIEGGDGVNDDPSERVITDGARGCTVSGGRSAAPTGLWLLIGLGLLLAVTRRRG